jgi:hypothetical protein
MSLTAPRPLWTRLASVGLAGTAALISSLWIAICAAAPEFIWQGARIARDHLTQADILSALLIGLVLDFFIEPAMERMRHLLLGVRPGESADDKPRNPLFIAGVALVFALASFCLGEAMTAFVSGRNGAETTDISGLAAGITLTTSWAIVPFFVTLAWLSARHRRVAIPMGIIAGTSPFITGWLFSWSGQEMATTAIPCVLILASGYNQASKEPRRRAFIRCARSVAFVAAVWLALSLFFSIILDFYGSDRLGLYSSVLFWEDMRFYCGWILGLSLAPFPSHWDKITVRR